MQMSFPLFPRETHCKRFDWFVHELHARRGCRLQHALRENIVLNSCIEARPGHAFFVSRALCRRFSAPQDRVDRFIERTHTVVAASDVHGRLANPNAEPLTISIK